MAQSQRKKVAALFSGGDAPEMNALLRAFVRLGHNRHQARVVGVKDGYLGLVRSTEQAGGIGTIAGRIERQIRQAVGRAGLADRDQQIVLLDDRSVSRIIDQGGIVLGASRCEDFCDARVRQRVARLLEELAVSAVVVVGGEGSLQGAEKLAQEGHLQVIGIPATIDNDCQLTERALGVDTAINTILECVRRVNDTACSHHRIMVLEIMGRRCGHLAQTAALAAGAEIVITPERGPVTEKKLEDIGLRLEESMYGGRRHAVVLVTEGVQVEGSPESSPAKAVADRLQTFFQRAGAPFSYIDTRHTVLGHVQRGGSPTAADRLLAADLAEAAWKALTTAKRRSGVLGLVSGRIELQNFPDEKGAQRNADYVAEIQRVYQLQKDVSKCVDLAGGLPSPLGAGRHPVGRMRSAPPDSVCCEKGHAGPSVRGGD